MINNINIITRCTHTRIRAPNVLLEISTRRYFPCLVRTTAPTASLTCLVGNTAHTNYMLIMIKHTTLFPPLPLQLTCTTLPTEADDADSGCAGELGGDDELSLASRAISFATTNSTRIIICTLVLVDVATSCRVRSTSCSMLRN
jgi:hypothetical protein